MQPSATSHSAFVNGTDISELRLTVMDDDVFCLFLFSQIELNVMKWNKNIVNQPKLVICGCLSFSAVLVQTESYCSGRKGPWCA